MDEELRRKVLQLGMQNAVLSMELRETQKTLLRLMAYVSRENAQGWKDSFVKRRNELGKRMLARWEDIDPELVTEILNSHLDEFDDWLDPYGADDDESDPG